MDCQEVRELLDAYALGATEPAESEGLERHLSDCIRCWEELSEVQRTAAALSLAVGIEAAPARLRDRVLSQAEREGCRERGFWGIRRALGRGWPALAGAVAVAGVAALAFAAVLQLEVNDLRDENDELAFQLQASSALLDEQRQILSVMAAPDMEELNVGAVSADSEAVGVYYWSTASQRGVLACSNLPHLQADQVYQAWLLTDEGWESGGTFRHQDGFSQLSVDLSALSGPPEAIGVSVEGSGGSDRPTGEMLLREELSTR